MSKAIDSENFRAKHDEGKLQLRLVPPQIIRDIAEVRMYGNAKYGDPDNWKTVEKWRYIDALFRHFLLYLEDPAGVDEESGIKHYKHMACNMAFICAMEAKDESRTEVCIRPDQDCKACWKNQICEIKDKETRERIRNLINDRKSSRKE